ncbi:MAG: hypothetical protein A2018_02820 [Alphaproteobacteria bacterium GWF2_58_20]|nr:MAG: hypothetical protein A2018_02820 [Alphaproteobacteria bacterium GWF2_58_20]
MQNVYIVLGVVALIALYVGMTYNNLFRMRVNNGEAWSDIKVQLKRRHDLIPMLVETVKGYAKHEQSTFEKVVQARAEATAAEGASPARAGAAEGGLVSALRGLLAVAEAYPDLKANTNFLDLQKQLADVEEKLAASRRFFNGNIRVYNQKVGMFPSNLVAGMFHFASAEFFELPEEEAAAAGNRPDIKFG